MVKGIYTLRRTLPESRLMKIRPRTQDLTITPKQSGLMRLRIADLLRDSNLLDEVQTTALHIQKQAPQLIDPLIERWLPRREAYLQACRAAPDALRPS